MLLTVVASEYVRRVRTKAFVLSTLLGPVALAVLGVAIAAIVSSVESESARERRLAVLDESSRILPALEARENETYLLQPVRDSIEDAKQAVVDGEVDVLLVLPRSLAEAGEPSVASAYVKDKQSVMAEQALRAFLVDVVRDVRLAEYDLPAEVLDTLNATLTLTTVAVTESGDEEEGSAASSAAVGVGVGVVLLMVVWIYGALVMQATMEEKTSRMAEILVSSVRPFDLLFGKILAVGGVAATQLSVWLVMLVAFGVLAAGVVPAADLAEMGLSAPAETAGGAVVWPAIRFDVVAVVLLMLPLGYLINASLFGALGAMYESTQEAQVAVTIAMMPMIVAMLMVQIVSLVPNSALVVFGSYFPFTAPVMLPARMLVADMGAWQVLASVALCASSALAVIWLAGRVFRGSLLIYGKKLALKEIWTILRAD
ncbi:MAG: ABC transporter permease [Gammaproteobacteria bacterium]|nr:ABC transporter permease [Gammaproteobacteria bacterium]